jgi:PAS domain S-box-containing protein
MMRNLRAFLSGVLFAAIAATATQASKSQWLVMRRTRQLQRVKGMLSDEVARLERTAEALRIAESRFNLVGDALPEMIVFVDRDGRCHYHNRAFAQWRGRSGEQIEGQMLREVLGDDIWQEINSHRAKVLAGKEIRYKVQSQLLGGGIEHCAVTLLPYPPGAMCPAGYYALFASRMESAVPAPAAVRGALVGNGMTGSHENVDMFYQESVTEHFSNSSDPRAQLLRALQENHFVLFAQKIQPLAASAPDQHCFEILLRLQKEMQDLLPPGGFFPVAERHGLMGEIDRWVVRNVIKWCLDKQRSEPAWQMPVYCVNLAAASLCEPDFALDVRDELQRHEFPAANLCFEISEPEVTGHHAEVRAFMAALRPLGCRFTLDAFGSSKVSFAPLKGLAFDFLKIDGVIIQNILTDPANLAKIRTIASASRKMGMHTIAEFVESDATLAKLREIGVDYAQGFGIGRPGAIAQVS